MRKTIALLLCLLPVTLFAQPADLPRNNAAPGWNYDALKAAEKLAGQSGSTAGLVMQHDAIIYSWGDIAHRTNIHSCRKSILSALMGIAVQKHQVDLNATLASLGMDDKPPSLTDAEKQAKLVDLIEARSGIYHPAAYETNGMKDKRPARGSHAPGTFWYYNNWDFNALGAVYEKATGTKIFDAFYEQIAKPMGMQDYTPKDGHYQLEDVSLYPAYLFNLSPRDFARFGLLFLHKGRWNGQQIVPAAWVARSTQPYSDVGSGGYAYLWWTADDTSGHPGKTPFPKGAFWAEGHYGQYSMVIPSQDMVIVSMVDHDIAKGDMSKAQMSQVVKLIMSAQTKP